MWRHGFEAGLNEASTRRQIGRDATLRSVEVWFEAGFNMASTHHVFSSRFAEMHEQEVWRHGFEAGPNEASTKPQICRDAILGSVEAWFEAGFNMATTNYQFSFRFAEMY